MSPGDDYFFRRSFCCPFGLDCSVCSDGYTTQLGYTCDKCTDNTGGLVAVALVVMLTVLVGAAVFVYATSVEIGCMGRGGSLGRLFRNIPLQSVKIVIVAWQILTQVER